MTVPPGSELLVMLSAGGAIVILNPFDTKAPAVSVTRTVNGNDPARLGVPEMLLPLSPTPSGKLPDSSDHAYRPVPPVALREAE